MAHNNRLLERAAYVLIALADRLGRDEHPCPRDHFTYVDRSAEDEDGHPVPGGGSRRAHHDALWAMARVCQLAATGGLQDHPTVHDGRPENDGRNAGDA